MNPTKSPETDLRCGRYAAHWSGPLGRGLMAGDGRSIVGLWFEGQRHFGSTLAPNYTLDESRPEFHAARRWLTEYFAGRNPNRMPPIRLSGTDFQRRVWIALLTIPWAQTTTYAHLASRLNTSPRAIGSAVARNPISLIIPCHRVISTKNTLTGYAAGLPLKHLLLTLELSPSLLPLML